MTKKIKMICSRCNGRGYHNITEDEIDSKYLSCHNCKQEFRNPYRLEEKNAKYGYDYFKCPDCNN